MDEKYGQVNSPTPHNVSTKTQPNRRDGTPNPESYIPVREASLQKNNTSLLKELSTSDKDVYEYEEYLRKKWPVNEAIPDSFDPLKLEAVLKSRFPRKIMHGELSETSKPIPQEEALGEESSHTSAGIYSRGGNALDGSIIPGLVNQSIETDEESGDDESEDLELLIDNVTSMWSQANPNTMMGNSQATPESSRHPSTPRIGAGSKPPLSRSAYSKGLGQGERKKSGVAKPPEYFPFKDRKRRQSTSK
ncbi:hypothetical protein F4859DRAFT_328792 [Xylaria cf. heliscus]|nr:hypothetical protein F4859DRAFT_328792 [Xylaria cf. heliscus]